MKKINKLASISVICLLLLSCTNESSKEVSANYKEMVQLNEAFNKSIAEKKLDDVLKLYSENMIWLPPNQKRKFGLEPVKENYHFIVSNDDIKLSHKLDTAFIAKSKDLAVMIGSYYFERNGKEIQKDEGKFALTLIKENGEWKITSDLFNSDF